MEQARYWMLTKREHSMRAHVQASSYNDSWEEQAFAEDSAGPLGGCIWPPRSYSCNFCRREFKSAQALGGHMNVHRRDRARLKQSPCPHNEILNQHHQNHENPSTSLGVQYPSQVCTLLYNPKCNSNPSIIASPLSPSKVSSPYTQENCSEQIFFSPIDSPPTVQEQQKVSFFSAPPSWSDSVSVKILTVSDPKIKEKKNLILKESGCGSEGDYVKPDLAVSLNFVVRRNHSSETDGGDEEAISRKRRRTDATSLPFFLKPDPVDRHHFQSEVLGHSQSSMEDLDLELRLGDRPKVK